MVLSQQMRWALREMVRGKTSLRATLHRSGAGVWAPPLSKRHRALGIEQVSKGVSTRDVYKLELLGLVERARNVPADSHDPRSITLAGWREGWKLLPAREQALYPPERPW